MRLLVTGAGGLLGTEVVPMARDRGHDVVSAARADLDVTDREAVTATLRHHCPDVVIHGAAYTAVDRAEEEPGEAHAVNVDGAHNVAAAAADVGAVCVYVSTDFVFDGRSDRPYPPDAPTAPLSVYGRTKRDGERVVADADGAHLIVRTSWVYGAGGRNFLTAVLERARQGQALKVVSDQTGRPTWARNLARGILDLVDVEARGTWHVADGGWCTWYELARHALEVEDLDVPVEPVTSEAWGAPAPRPRYSVLDVSATEALLGRQMTPWTEAVSAYLTEER